MTWWFCRSWQILSHSMGTMWLGWMTTQFFYCFPNLPELAHAPTIHVEWITTYSCYVVLHIPTYTSLWMACWFGAISKSDHIAWVLYGLNGYYSSVMIMSQAFQTFVYAHTIHIEWAATHPWFLVFHVTTYTSLRMSWWFCSSCQIWFHSLCALCIVWTGSQCLDCVPGLSDLFDAPTRHMECLATHPWHVLFHSPIFTILRMVWFFWVTFPQTLLAALGYSASWMNIAPVYWLCPRFVKPYIYILKACGMDGITSITFGYYCHNIHNPDDGIVVLQFLQNPIPLFEWPVAWMNKITVYWLCPRFVRPFPCTHKICGMGGKTSIDYDISCHTSQQQHKKSSEAERYSLNHPGVGSVYWLHTMSSCFVDRWYHGVLYLFTS